MKLVYNAFGLCILSEIPLPELPRITNQAAEVDIKIEIADLSNKWNEMAIYNKKNMIVKENLYMFQLRHTAMFCIQDGSKIIVSPCSGADFDKIRLFILGTCMGALLMQRKILPLHGSSIVINGKAFAFIGERGAGKSTIAAAFLRKGYELLTDDVIAIEVKKNLPHVIPSYPQQKLWQESLEEFGEDASQFRPLYDRETKYSIPVLDKYYTAAVPLGGVFELVKTESDRIDIKSIDGLNRLHGLYIHTFRQFLLNGFGLREWHFKTTASLSNQIRMYRLERPMATFTADQLVTLVLETIAKVESTNDSNTETLVGR